MRYYIIKDDWPCTYCDCEMSICQSESGAEINICIDCGHKCFGENVNNTGHEIIRIKAKQYDFILSLLR